MPLLNIVIALVVVGFALWLINRLIPMESTIRGILNAVVVIAVGVWLLQVFGLWGRLTSYKFSN
jgi:thiol:disulfide interchange protein